MFHIFPIISGKFSRLEQYKSLSFLREGKLRGGNLLSFLQCCELNNLSLDIKPTESSIAVKLSQHSKESFSKFGRSDMSGIRVKS